MDEDRYRRSVRLSVPATVVGAVGLTGFVFVASQGFGRPDDGPVSILVVFALIVAVGLAGVSAAPLVYRTGRPRAARRLSWASAVVVLVGGMVGLSTVIGLLMVAAAGLAGLSAMHLTWRLGP